MSRMLGQHQIHTDERQHQLHKEFEIGHESEMKLMITSIILQHVQLLNVLMTQERIERQKAISDMQGQIIILRDKVRALNSNSNLRLRDAGADEVVIDDFGQKSKDDAVMMVTKIENITIFIAK